MTIAEGIAAYDHEQRMFKRLLRKRGSFTHREFDAWIMGREFRRKPRFRQMTGSTYMLGITSGSATYWAEMLELLQIMARLGVVACEQTDDLVVYSIGAKFNELLTKAAP